MDDADDYQFYSFDKENSILKHDITSENSFDEISHLISMSKFSTLIHKYHPQNIIVSIYKEPANYDLRNEFFNDSVVLKAINEAGVTKIGFYFSERKYLEMYIHTQKAFPFEIKISTDLQEINDWIKE
jgi:hypothetical protein